MQILSNASHANAEGSAKLSMLKYPEQPRAVEERPDWLSKQIYLHPLGFGDIAERNHPPTEQQK